MNEECDDIWRIEADGKPLIELLRFSERRSIIAGPYTEATRSRAHQDDEVGAPRRVSRFRKADQRCHESKWLAIARNYLCGEWERSNVGVAASGPWHTQRLHDDKNYPWEYIEKQIEEETRSRRTARRSRQVTPL